MSMRDMHNVKRGRVAEEEVKQGEIRSWIGVIGYYEGKRSASEKAAFVAASRRLVLPIIICENEGVLRFASGRFG